MSVPAGNELETASSGTQFGPLKDGSVALGLYMGDGSAIEQVNRLVEESRFAETAGFDGVTFSEHHIGMPLYLPVPLLAANWVLGSTERLWSGPMPTLLTLTNARTTTEQLAWTAARFPGRLCYGMAPGSRVADFELFRETFDKRAERFTFELEDLAECIRPDGPLADDKAVGAGILMDVPRVVGVGSMTAVRRALANGFGLQVGGDFDKAAKLAVAYRELGGDGPVVLQRRVWVGEPPAAMSRNLEDVYRAADAAIPAGPDGGSVDEVVERIIDQLSRSRANSLNLRVHVPGVAQADILDQIELLGRAVIPKIRSEAGFLSP